MKNKDAYDYSIISYFLQMLQLNFLLPEYQKKLYLMINSSYDITIVFDSIHDFYYYIFQWISNDLAM